METFSRDAGVGVGDVTAIFSHNDHVWIGGTNGLELLSALVTQNIVGQFSRIGFGSSLGVVLLVIALGPIIVFLNSQFRSEAKR